MAGGDKIRLGDDPSRTRVISYSKERRSRARQFFQLENNLELEPAPIFAQSDPWGAQNSIAERSSGASGRLAAGKAESVKKEPAWFQQPLRVYVFLRTSTSQLQLAKTTVWKNNIQLGAQLFEHRSICTGVKVIRAELPQASSCCIAGQDLLPLPCFCESDWQASIEE